MNTLPVKDLISLWEAILKKGNCSIEILSDELEFKFDSTGLETTIDFLKKINLLENNGNKFFTIKRKNDLQKIYFFKDTKSLFGTLRSDSTLINKYNFFVFDYDSHYLYYDHSSKQVVTNSKNSFTSFLFDHYLAYIKLLEVFKSNIPLIVEIDKSTTGGNELIVISKGADKFITSIKYQEVDDTIFNRIYSRIPLEEFKLRLINEEWVASFKNVLCQYIELQGDPYKTFGTLYQNFTYIYNQTEKDYQLFISKFSFDKIRKQFKVEKNAYFDALNTAQDKITAQIISVPLSLGASVFSFYQLSVHANILALVYLGILIYSAFIIYSISIYLKDIKKLAKDINEEETNLSQHFESLLKDFQEDFNYMKSKRRHIRVLGYSIITALIVTLAAITYYLITYKENQAGLQFKFL